MRLTNVQNALLRARYTRFRVCANHENMVVFQDDIFLVQYLMTVSKSMQKMFQSPNVGSITPTLCAKDSRAKKLGLSPRTPRSNDQATVLIVVAIESTECELWMDLG